MVRGARSWQPLASVDSFDEGPPVAIGLPPDHGRVKFGRSTCPFSGILKTETCPTSAHRQYELVFSRSDEKLLDARYLVEPPVNS